MSTPVTWNGNSYNIPAAGELNWSSLSNFLIALGNNAAVSGGATTYGSRVVTSTLDTAVGPTDTVILTNIPAPSVITLPTSVGNTGRVLVIVDYGNSALTSSRPITVTPFSGDLINGAATYVIGSDGGAVILVGATNGWTVMGAYEGSKILNSRTTATNANTASAIVARDGSGNFTAGTITAALTGNATTATTAANLSGSNLTGDVTNVANAMTIPNGTITNAKVNASAAIVDTKLATIATAGKVSNSATTATNANTASAIVARDASGNFSAGTITAALSGNATTATSATSATSAANLSGSNLTGDVTNVANAMTIPAGTITNAMVNASAAIVDTKLATISTALKVSNSATTAASANTASAIVARDSSGNFSAGTITAALSGNATTATSAATAGSATTAGTATSATSITGNLTGDVTSSGMATTITSGIITNAMINASAGIVDTKLATISTASKVSNSATTATSANTNSAIVARNGSGDFSAGAVTVSQLNNTGVVGLAQIATPTAPLSTVTNVYAKTDGKIYRQTSDGEFGIGSGNGSGINYLTDWNDGSKAVNLVSTVGAAGNVSVTGSYTTATSAWYADATSGASVTAGSFVVGKAYVITFVGTTNFVSIGAASSTIGVTFVATGVGTGTGTAGSSAIYSNTNITLRGTTNYLTQLSSASTSGATFVQSPVFCVDGTDLGKALAIQFDVIGNTTADDWDVVAVRYDSGGVFGALIPIAGIASSTTGTASAQVPTGTTTFRGFFITNSTASDVYSIRWRRRAGAVAIRLDNLIVGPNSVMTGTAITDWRSYPTAQSNFPITASTDLWKYRQVANILEANLTFRSAISASASEAYIDLPTGLTVDTSVFSNAVADLDATANFGAVVGRVDITDSATGLNLRYQVVIKANSTTRLVLTNSALAGATETLSGAFSTYTRGATVKFEVPITGWSSNVTMADRAVEEYVSNSGTSTTVSDTTSFAYGAAGSQIQNITAALSRRVRFSTPIQTTDSIVVEIRPSGSTVFIPVQSVATDSSGNAWFQPWTYQNGVEYGMGRILQVSGSTTDVDIRFGQYAMSTSTYGAIGQTWASGSPAAGAAFYRVRKVSGGAAVGFPVGARNVIGDVSGTAVPAGYIGEILTGTIANSGASYTTGTLKNVNSVALTAGTWLVYTYPTIAVGTALGANSLIVQSISSSPSAHQSEVRCAASLTADNYLNPAIKYVNVSSATPYYLNVTVSFSSGTCTNAASTLMYAVRIA